MQHSEEKTPTSSLDFDSMTLEQMAATLERIQSSRTIPRATKALIFKARLEKYEGEMDELLDRCRCLQKRHELIQRTMKNLRLSRFSNEVKRG